MKRVLITGANSYIGTSFEKWLEQSEGDYQVETLDMMNPEWKNCKFAKYDSIFHVAGIAHFSKDDKKKDLYYKVNTELTYDVALKAKNEGVKQFIFMSSIIVYGDSTSKIRVISKSTEPNPSDYYGDSKWQAEQRISVLQSDEFKIAIIRPPMIYGKGSKGNYPRLSRLSKLIPIIPEYKNQRSMLYVGNLMEFLKNVIDKNLSGVFFPQNMEYVSTSNLMIVIAKLSGHKFITTRLLNPLIDFLFFNDNIKKCMGISLMKNH